jgi:hypothetical protein
LPKIDVGGFDPCALDRAGRSDNGEIDWRMRLELPAEGSERRADSGEEDDVRRLLGGHVINIRRLL